MKAAKFLGRNLISNILFLIVNLLGNLLLTGYLVRKLGLTVYGIIPMIGALVSYVGFFTEAINAALSRFISISFYSDDQVDTSMYFSTAVLALSGISILMVVLSITVTPCLDMLFDIPTGVLVDSKLYFIAATGSFVLASMSSVFSVSTIIMHRFDIQNIGKIGSKIMYYLAVFYFFGFIRPSLINLGLALIISNALLLGYMIKVHGILTPKVVVSKNLYRSDYLLQMSNTGIWNILNSLATPLYLAMGLFILNIGMGAEFAGKYAPVVQVMLVLGLLTTSLSTIFTPVAYEMAAKNNLTDLAYWSVRLMFLIGLIIIVPLGIIATYAKSLFEYWLGEEVDYMPLLVNILITAGVIYLPARPLFIVSRAVNKVKIPSIYAMLGGIANLALSIVLLKYTNYGIYGIALSSAIFLAVKNNLAMPIYNGIITNTSKTLAIKVSCKLLFIFFVFCGLLEMVNYLVVKDNLLANLLGTSIVISLYISAVYNFMLSDKERKLIWRTLRKEPTFE